MELVIVVVILGIIGAIALPRLGGRVERTKMVRLLEDTSRYQEAIERYKIEHGGRSPAHDESGALDSSGANMIARLVSYTDEDGKVTASGLFGPYLRAGPKNSMSGLDTVRVAGAAAGAGTHGWRYGPNTGLIEPDNLSAIERGTIEAAVATGGKNGGADALELGR